MEQAPEKGGPKGDPGNGDDGMGKAMGPVTEQMLW